MSNVLPEQAEVNRFINDLENHDVVLATETTAEIKRSIIVAAIVEHFKIDGDLAIVCFNDWLNPVDFDQWAKDRIILNGELTRWPGSKSK